MTFWLLLFSPFRRAKLAMGLYLTNYYVYVDHVELSPRPTNIQDLPPPVLPAGNGRKGKNTPSQTANHQCYDKEKQGPNWNSLPSSLLYTRRGPTAYPCYHRDSDLPDWGCRVRSFGRPVQEGRN